MAKSNGNIKMVTEFIDEYAYVETSIAILEETGNLRLVGDTGAGKTHLTHKLSEKLGLPLFEIVLTRDITKWDLLSCDILKKGETVNRKGIILQWLESEGGILYLDGFNYGEPSILSLIESLADFRGTVWIPELNKTFKRGEKHYLVISYNPSEKIGYSGTFTENIATIRRLEGIKIEYLSPQNETGLVQVHCDNKYDFARKFVEIANKTRALYKEGKLKTPLTTGNLINYAKLYKRGLSEQKLIDIASSLYPEEEKELFVRLFEESGDVDVEKLKKKEE